MEQRITADCVARARALAPRIAAAAARIEAGRELPPDVVEALHEARLFRMLVPHSLDGEEVSPVAFMHAIEELAKADASTAWCVAQTSVCSTISSCLKPQIAAEIFKNDPRGVLAWGPSTSKAKAIAEPGGCATIKDVWHVIGLKGTGSDTYTLTDVFVPEDCAIAHHALDRAERHEHGPLYSFTIYQLFGSSFPAIALGIARAMLDAFIELAKTKTPAGGKSLLRDNSVIQSQVGVAESQLAAARTFFFAAWNEIWRAAQDDAVTLDQRVQLRMASIHANQQARQIAETAYLAAGATAIFEGNPFERRFRDMHAVSQQAQAQFAIFEVIGRHFLGLPLQSTRI